MTPGAFFTNTDARIMDALPTFNSPSWITAGSVGARCNLTIDEARARLRELASVGLVRHGDGWPVRWALAEVIA